MHHPGQYPWIDAQLRGVPVPDGLVKRLREVALADDAGLDDALRGVPLPSGLPERLRWSIATEDPGLDALLRGVPVPYRVMCNLRATPGRRATFQRIANWVVAATLMVAIGLSYLGAAMGLLIAGLPVRPEPKPQLAWFIEGGLLPDMSDDALGVLRLESLAEVASVGGQAETGPAVEWPRPPSLLEAAPPAAPIPIDEFTLFARRLPGGVDPLLDVTPYRWSTALGSHAPFDEPPGWQEASLLRPRGIPAPTVPAFDSGFRIRYGIFPFVPTAADDALRAVSLPLNVGTDSYELTRRSVAEGRLPPPGAIRTEEFLAALDYGFPEPVERATRLSMFGGPSPFVPGAFVLQAGVKAVETASAPRPPVHLVLTLDVSAGPRGEQRISILRQALGELERWLLPDDKLSLVAFHRGAEVLAERASPEDIDSLQAALARLAGQAMTNPGAGLAAAYALARTPDESQPDLRPMVVFFTDGMPDLPLGDSVRVERQLADAAAEGIALQVVASRLAAETFHAQLQTFAAAGSGRLWPVDDPRQFAWALREAVTGQPQRVAENVRLTVRFEPKAVPFYRVLGHEPGAVTMEVASVLHAGQCGTALFDVRLRPGLSPGEVLATAELTWREPGGGLHQRETVVIRRGDVPDTWVEAPPPVQAAIVAAEAGELLRRSVFTQYYRPRQGSLAALAELIDQVDSTLWEEPSFRDFAEVVQRAVKARPHRGGGAR